MGFAVMTTAFSHIRPMGKCEGENKNNDDNNKNNIPTGDISNLSWA